MGELGLCSGIVGWEYRGKVRPAHAKRWMSVWGGWTNSTCHSIVAISKRSLKNHWMFLIERCFRETYVLGKLFWQQCLRWIGAKGTWDLLKPGNISCICPSVRWQGFRLGWWQWTDINGIHCKDWQGTERLQRMRVKKDPKGALRFAARTNERLKMALTNIGRW